MRAQGGTVNRDGAGGVRRINARWGSPTRDGPPLNCF